MNNKIVVGKPLTSANTGEEVAVRGEDGVVYLAKALTPIVGGTVLVTEVEEGEFRAIASVTKEIDGSAIVRRRRPRKVEVSLYPFKALIRTEGSLIYKVGDGGELVLSTGFTLEGISNTGVDEDEFCAALRNADGTQLYIFNGQTLTSYATTQLQNWRGCGYVDGVSSTTLLVLSDLSADFFFNPFVVTSDRTQNSYANYTYIYIHDTQAIYLDIVANKLQMIYPWTGDVYESGALGSGPTTGYDAAIAEQSFDFEYTIDKTIAPNYELTTSVNGTVTSSVVSGVFFSSEVRNHTYTEQSTATETKYLNNLSVTTNVTYNLEISASEQSTFQWDLFEFDTKNTGYSNITETCTFSEDKLCDRYLTPDHQVEEGSLRTYNYNHPNGSGVINRKGHVVVLAGEADGFLLYYRWIKNLSFTLTDGSATSGTGTLPSENLIDVVGISGIATTETRHSDNAIAGSVTINCTRSRDSFKKIDGLWLRVGNTETAIATNNSFCIVHSQRLTVPDSGAIALDMSSGTQNIYFADVEGELRYKDPLTSFTLVGNTTSGASYDTTNANWVYLETAPVFIVQKQANDAADSTVSVWEATITSTTQTVDISDDISQDNFFIGRRVEFRNAGGEEGNNNAIYPDGTPRGSYNWFSNSGHRYVREGTEFITADRKYVSRISVLNATVTAAYAADFFFPVSSNSNYNKTYIFSRSNFLATILKLGTPANFNLVDDGGYKIYACVAETIASEFSETRQRFADVYTLEDGDWVRGEPLEGTVLETGNTAIAFTAPSYYPVD